MTALPEGIAEELRQIVREAVAEALAATAPRTSNDDQLLTAKEAGALVGCSTNALAIAAHRGKLDGVVVRLGRSKRYKRRELLEAWGA